MIRAASIGSGAEARRRERDSPWRESLGHALLREVTRFDDLCAGAAIVAQGGAWRPRSIAVLVRGVLGAVVRSGVPFDGVVCRCSRRATRCLWRPPGGASALRWQAAPGPLASFRDGSRRPPTRPVGAETARDWGPRDWGLCGARRRGGRRVAGIPGPGFDHSGTRAVFADGETADGRRSQGDGGVLAPGNCRASPDRARDLGVAVVQGAEAASCQAFEQ